MPLALSKVHPKFRTPYRAIVLYALIAILLLVPGFFTRDIFVRLGGLYAFGSLLAFALAHTSIIRLRIKHPEMPRPFKLKGNIVVRGHELPITAILGLVATSVIWTIVLVVQPYARWVGLGWMAIGTLVYIVFRRRRQLPLTKVAPVVKASID